MLALLVISAISSFVLSGLVLLLPRIPNLYHLALVWTVLSGAAGACWFACYNVLTYSPALYTPSLAILVSSAVFHLFNTTYLCTITWYRVVGTRRSRKERQEKFLQHERILSEYRDLAQTEWDKCYAGESTCYEDTDGIDISSMDVDIEHGRFSTTSGECSSSLDSILSTMGSVSITTSLSPATSPTLPFPSFCRSPEISIFKNRDIVTWDEIRNVDFLNDHAERMV
ncbi:hypothetical protein CJU90_0930 [Yarrowia sp. C11]|nr:hypothetical protein CKK34_2343 [Yarrowia sp. E02]KAG5373244.1 hypothetical protein CJU90_0930 [Yarrowia sp. C11]